MVYDFQFMLELTDEKIDAWCDMTCRLAKHRRSDTIDRKDAQLAYGASFSFKSERRRTEYRV